MWPQLKHIPHKMTENHRLLTALEISLYKCICALRIMFNNNLDSKVLSIYT